VFVFVFQEAHYQIFPRAPVNSLFLGSYMFISTSLKLLGYVLPLVWKTAVHSHIKQYHASSAHNNVLHLRLASWWRRTRNVVALPMSEIYNPIYGVLWTTI
jgi:hypothetical protein